MPPEAGVMIAVLLGAATGLIAKTWTTAIAGSAFLYLFAKVAFSVFGVILDIAKGPASEAPWFASVLGQLIAGGTRGWRTTSRRAHDAMNMRLTPALYRVVPCVRPSRQM
jgi:hypothetical protein